jgi:hypothetical protein
MQKASPPRSEIQWTGENTAEVRRFLGERCVGAHVVMQLVIATADGGTETVVVPRDGWVGYDGSQLHVRPHSERAAEQLAGAPTLESLVDHLAFDGGYD